MKIIKKYFEKNRIKKQYQKAENEYLESLDRFFMIPDINSEDDEIKQDLIEIQLKFRIMNEFRNKLESLK